MAVPHDGQGKTTIAIVINRQTVVVPVPHDGDDGGKGKTSQPPVITSFTVTAITTTHCHYHRLHHTLDDPIAGPVCRGWLRCSHHPRKNVLRPLV